MSSDWNGSVPELTSIIPHQCYQHRHATQLNSTQSYTSYSYSSIDNYVIMTIWLLHLTDTLWVWKNYDTLRWSLAYTYLNFISHQPTGNNLPILRYMKILHKFLTIKISNFDHYIDSTLSNNPIIFKLFSLSKDPTFVVAYQYSLSLAFDNLNHKILSPLLSSLGYLYWLVPILNFRRIILN